MKNIDIWTAGCYITVFVPLLEYCAVLFLTQKASWEAKIKAQKVQGRSKKMNDQDSEASAIYILNSVVAFFMFRYEVM